MDTSDHTTNFRTCKSCNTEYPLTSEFWHRDKTALYGFAYACKECAKKRSRKWVADNSERNKENCKAWYYGNSDKVAQYRNDNAKQIAATKRKYRQEHPEETKKHKLDSQKRNRASANKRAKRWRERHPDTVRIKTRIRSNKRRAAEGNYTQADVDVMFRSQKGLCWWCGKPLPAEVMQGSKRRIGFDVDHRIAIEKGGTNDPSNLVLSCIDCNLSKQDKLPHEWTDRLL